MNEQQIDSRLTALARADAGIGAPQDLRDLMRALESGQRQPRRERRSIGNPLPERIGRSGRLVRDLVRLAACLVIAAGLLMAVLPRNQTTRPLQAPAATATFGPASWTRLGTIHGGADDGSSYVYDMRSESGLIYGLVSGNVQHDSPPDGFWVAPEVSVAQSTDGKQWTVSDALPDPITLVGLSPHDWSGSYSAVAKLGTRWVIVGGTGAHDPALASQGQGVVMVSDDGVSWREVTSARLPGYGYVDVVAAAWGFIAVAERTNGTGCEIWTSTDGLSWQVASLDSVASSVAFLPIAGGDDSTGHAQSIAFDPEGGYLLAGYDHDGSLVLLHSGNGHAWVRSKLDSSYAAELAVRYVNGRWTVDVLISKGQLAGGSKAHLETATSRDGETWTWEPPSSEFPSDGQQYSLRVFHGAETIGLATLPDGAEPTATQGPLSTGPIVAPTHLVAPISPGSSPAPVQPGQHIALARTVDLSTWTPAGVGPEGCDVNTGSCVTDAIATPDRLVIFVMAGQVPSTVIEVWSAPWP
jgi:hypothetical protein